MLSNRWIAGLAAGVALACALLTGPARGVAMRIGHSWRPQPRPSNLTVVIVALDGVRWQDVLSGVDRELADSHALAANERRSARDLMPNLYGLIDRGALVFGDAAEPITASGPNYKSLPGYAEMLTGRRVTGCLDNTCAGVTGRTLFDDCADLAAGDPFACAALTSWGDIERVVAEDKSRIVISTGRHGGLTRPLLAGDPRARATLEAAERERPYPGNGDFRPDSFTAQLATQYLKSHHPRLLFVGLGEPDAFAHRNDYRAYLAALGQCDRAIGELSRTLSELERGGRRTALFITTDHGRSRNFIEHGRKFPESARIWLVAAGNGLSERNATHAAGARHLADLAPTVRRLLDLPIDRDPIAGTPLLSDPVAGRLATNGDHVRPNAAPLN